ncbi:MAG: hypothetical protein ACYTGR_16905 [Planctomycetota bacterium]|jgi:hypothetical protein
MPDPLTELRRTDNPNFRHEAAMLQLDAEAPGDEAYQAALHRMIWVPGYNAAIREMALDRLAEQDLPALKRTIRQRYIHLKASIWATRLAAIIAERGWDDLTPALVGRLAWPDPLDLDSTQRPEYLAIESLHGEGTVVDVVFDVLMENRESWQQGLRMRCWSLIGRLGGRERLIELVATAEIDPDDAMLLDLRAAHDDLGIVPRMGEEIRWIRTIREPSRAAFWESAAAALPGLSADRRDALEMRDLAVVIAGARHDPDLLRASTDELYARLESTLEGSRHYHPVSPGNHARRHVLREWREDLTWGDLAAMLLAARALSVPQVVDHLFDYADRDHADETTEYGGLIDLDEYGRFVVHEYPPRRREHDQKFNATNDMFEAGYTALFHFHDHVQRHANADYAGPGAGDRRYAEFNRVNCLVFTFVDEHRLNVDFYRYGGLIVDLGTIHRNDGRRSGA